MQGLMLTTITAAEKKNQCKLLTDRWMDGWMDGRMDGWMDGRMLLQMDSCWVLSM